MYFYLTLSKRGIVNFSPPWVIDNPSPEMLSYLGTPLPLAKIQVVLRQLNSRNRVNHWRQGSSPRDIKLEILKILKDAGWDLPANTWQEFSLTSAIQQVKVQDNRGAKEFNQLVRGRQLSMGDLRRLARELRLEEEAIIHLAHLNVEQGGAQWVPAIKSLGSSWQCERCGENDVQEWPSHYGVAATCPSCESLGACTSLDVIYRDLRSLFTYPSEVMFQPHWVLTEAQQRASKQVLDFIQDCTAERALLWAACGAGKTEVCFPSAAWALKKGKSVLFAAPRQDVIQDIAPRLRRDFPEYPLQVLTGTSEVKFQNGGLVLATTHQVLRFYRAFDVIFMDEMDAFPFRGSCALEWGLKQALRLEGKILYLTATPSPESLKEVKGGRMKLIRLPARHHRRSLPVPSWERFRQSLEPGGWIDLDVAWIELLRGEGPVLVFVPKISWIEPWIKCFQQRFPDWCIDGSYSADQGRFAKVERLRRGDYDLFVSTTILERGITLSGIQVVVLAADHPVFDERALVQMAGRVGRTRENPAGRAVFCAKHLTPSMRTAVQWIEEQNKLALEQGLIEV